MRVVIVVLLGAAWTGGIHQEPATQSADITADTANLGSDEHDFGAFDDFDESASSGKCAFPDTTLLSHKAVSQVTHDMHDGTKHGTTAQQQVKNSTGLTYTQANGCDALWHSVCSNLCN